MMFKLYLHEAQQQKQITSHIMRWKWVLPLPAVQYLLIFYLLIGNRRKLLSSFYANSPIIIAKYHWNENHVDTSVLFRLHRIYESREWFFFLLHAYLAGIEKFPVWHRGKKVLHEGELPQPPLTPEFIQNRLPICLMTTLFAWSFAYMRVVCIVRNMVISTRYKLYDSF